MNNKITKTTINLCGNKNTNIRNWKILTITIMIVIAIIIVIYKIL